MKNVVITGSTRGIGFGLAEAFVKQDCGVIVSGRSQSGVDASVESLQAKYPQAHIVGHPCDVTDLSQVEQLWQVAQDAFSSVDIWINNAGIGHQQTPVWEISEKVVRTVVRVDLLGVVFGTQVAVRGMMEQGHGQVYNMEGFGSDGMVRVGMSIYGTTKRALRYFTKSVIKETKNTPVQVGSLSPGIVITDFITDMYQDDPAGFEKSKKFFNILGDRVETVTPWLAHKVLQNTKTGASFKWLTFGKVMARFSTAYFKRRDLFTPQISNQ